MEDTGKMRPADMRSKEKEGLGLTLSRRSPGDPGHNYMDRRYVALMMSRRSRNSSTTGMPLMSRRTSS